MSDFPIRYDADAGVIQLDGAGGASVLLGVLLKAKFGDAYDPEVLFHPNLAEIMVALQTRGTVHPQATSAPFDRAGLQTLARLIVNESWRSDWWKKSRDEQIDFIQTVVAAPHRLSGEQLDALFEDIETELYWRRRIVDAADGGKTSCAS